MVLDDTNGSDYTLDARDERIVEELVQALRGKARPSAEANNEAAEALFELPKNLGASFQIHGFRSHVQTVQVGEMAHRDTFVALTKLVRTGRLRGGVGRLYEGQLYQEAPFLIISQPNTPLIDPETGKVNGYCLVNGQYAGLIGDLRRSFPKIAFIAPDELKSQWRSIFKTAIDKDPHLAL